MNNEEFVTRWVVDTVRNKYPGDVALVVAHDTLLIGHESRADEPEVFCYFVPATERGESLARTFILDGTGYDIWSIPWERLQRFAELDEYNLTLLADGRLLYAMDEEWARRFEELKTRQLENLADPAKSRRRALECYSTAKTLFAEMQFADESDTRMLAGYVLDFLSRAVAFSEHMYFKRSQAAQPDELLPLENDGRLPEGYRRLYLDIITEKDPDRQRALCREVIILVRGWLEERRPDDADEKMDAQALSDWYAELSYTWLRIRHYASQGDYISAYMWGICLQSELDDVCRGCGLEKPRLMEYFDKDDMSAFISQAGRLEKMIRGAITAGGGVIHEYAGREDFLNENS